MKQRDIFLASEGDAWFERNQAALASSDNVWHGRIIELLGSLLSADLLPTSPPPKAARGWLRKRCPFADDSDGLGSGMLGVGAVSCCCC